MAIDPKEFQERQQQLKIVDSNEPSDIRTKLLEVGWQQRSLTCGDYCFFSHDFKRIGIERKAVNDFLGSLGDRLSRQLETCLDYYDRTVLLIEGSWKTVSAEDHIVSSRGIERYTWTMVWNYLQRFQDKGITIQLTVNEGHTIKRVNELYALYQKSYSMSGASKEFEDDRILAFPSGCRGKTAISCLTMFGSIEMICKAKIQDLMHVPNIGEKKATLIYNHFHKGYETEEKFNVIRDQLESLGEQVTQGKLL